MPEDIHRIAAALEGETVDIPQNAGTLILLWTPLLVWRDGETSPADALLVEHDNAVGQVGLWKNSGGLDRVSRALPVRCNSRRG